MILPFQLLGLAALAYHPSHSTNCHLFQTKRDSRSVRSQFSYELISTAKVRFLIPRSKRAAHIGTRLTNMAIVKSCSANGRFIFPIFRGRLKHTNFLRFSRTGKRDQIFLATKFGARGRGSPDNSSEYMRTCIEQSLSKMGTDYIDLFYVHVRFQSYRAIPTMTFFDMIARR